MGDATTDWVEMKTADEVPYYLQRSTGALSWDKPDALKDAGERERDTGDWVWAPHSSEGYVPAQVVRRLRTGGVECRDEHGRSFTAR